MDPGRNCAPWIGRSVCRTAMTCPERDRAGSSCVHLRGCRPVRLSCPGANKNAPDRNLSCQGRISFIRGATLIYGFAHTLCGIPAYPRQLTYAPRRVILRVFPAFPRALSGPFDGLFLPGSQRPGLSVKASPPLSPLQRFNVLNCADCTIDPQPCQGVHIKLIKHRDLARPPGSCGSGILQKPASSIRRAVLLPDGPAGAAGSVVSCSSGGSERERARASYS